MPIEPALRPLMGGVIAEGRDLCARLTKDLLAVERLEGDEARALWKRAARDLHTIKGTAATFGLLHLSRLAHALESALVPLRDSGAKLDAGQADLFLRGVDLLSTTFSELAQQRDEPETLIFDFMRALEPLTPAPTAPTAAPPPVTAPPPPAPAPRPSAPVPEEAGEEAATSWRVEAHQVEAVGRELERLRELRVRLEDRRRQVTVALGAGGRSDGRFLLQALGTSLQTDIEELEAVTVGLEEGLKAIASLPLQSLLLPLQRTVRELCRQLGKDARVSMVGGELSVDRHVLEALRGPLLHLVRNAVDHGLERPHVRERRHKDPTGALIFTAERHGNVLFLQLSDDGAGLDLERIREVASERSVVPEARLAAMTPGQLSQLIFLPAFSTRAEVSEVSGRGVGLDVVLAQVRALKGHVEVTSTPGQGTRFTLTLPVGHGSAPVVLVRCGEQLLGIPSTSVEAVLQASEERLQRAGPRLDLPYRDELLPVNDLGAALGLREAIPPGRGTPLLVVQAQGRRRAWLVDEALGEHDLVIRPLGPELQRLGAWQGAVSLWRGELGLVLRTEWLVAAEREAPAGAGALRALVVDDSVSARAVHRAALEAGGYVVHVAQDGRQALAMLAQSSYAVVICDVGMEAMDGIALTEAVRAMPATRRLPIILVSGHESPAVRHRGLAAGANAFLSKRECAAGRLLAEVAQVLREGRNTA